MTNVKKLALGLGVLLSWTITSAASGQAALPPEQPQPEMVAQSSVEEPAETTQATPDDFQPASREKIEELLDLTNADSMSAQILEQMIGQFRQLSPEVPDEWWNGFIEKALESDINSLLIPIYERNYTAEEVDGMIEFYRTPVGQSLIAKTPTVTQESIVVGQAWGLQLAEELIAELEADGYEFSVEEPASEAAPQSQ